MESNVLTKKEISKGEKGGLILKDIFDRYASVFLPRLGNKCPRCEEFKAFFRYQLATYLSLKKNYTLALPEGDMVSDLILDTYEEFEEDVELSMIPITNEGRENMVSDIRIKKASKNDPYNDILE